MMSKSIQIVRDRIITKHANDKEQIEIIFSPLKRILVEAPAGYGKTNTMVSKIAYMIADRQILNPKRLLALTFSVNAAYKIKKDVTQQVPLLLKDSGLNISTIDKIFVSNYHGFCRGILRKYGMVFSPNFQSIDQLKSIDDNDVRRNQETIKGLVYEDAYLMSEFSLAIKTGNEKYLTKNFDNYNDIIIKKFLPAGYISYNAILTLVLKLFREYPNILKFYNQYFNSLLIDEYQDTNILCFWIVYLLISESTKVILFGDSLQRIYGFIGAVHNLLPISETKFALKKIQLTTNHRFATNPDMLQLDSNIRRNAENPGSPQIKKNVIIKLFTFETQSKEALAVAKTADKMTHQNPGTKVAILVKQRGGNVDSIIEALEMQHIPYFYGLFTDEDVKYIQFHKRALNEFIELIKIKNHITKKLSVEHIKKMKGKQDEANEVMENALLGLLEIFWTKIFSNYPSSSNDEKIILIKDTFEHNSLKQYMEFVKSNIVLSTVHAAKGLEWDYVIIPDMEQESFPNWIGGLCNKGGCAYKSNCHLQINKTNEIAFIEELSVFYVAVTRARKQIYFTASKIDSRGYSKNLSCLLKLPGITYSK